MRFRIAGVLAALVLAAFGPSGPAGAQPAWSVKPTLTPDQQQGLEDGRKFVRQFLKIYKPLYSVDLSPEAWVGAPELTDLADAGTVFNPAMGRIHINPEALTSPYRDALLAVTLAGPLVRKPSQATRLADYEREQRQRRLDGAVKAVEILARTRGVPEPAALKEFYAYLETILRWQPPARPEAPPEVSACQVIRHLDAQFPQHRAAAPAPACTP
jgi:hypothetical protein